MKSACINIIWQCCTGFSVSFESRIRVFGTLQHLLDFNLSWVLESCMEEAEAEELFYKGETSPLHIPFLMLCTVNSMFKKLVKSSNYQNNFSPGADKCCLIHLQKFDQKWLQILSIIRKKTQQLNSKSRGFPQRSVRYPALISPAILIHGLAYQTLQIIYLVLIDLLTSSIVLLCRNSLKYGPTRDITPFSSVSLKGFKVFSSASHYWPLEDVDGIHEFRDTNGGRQRIHWQWQ